MSNSFDKYIFRTAKSAIDHIIANEGNGVNRGPPGMGGQHGGGGGGGGGGFFEMIVAGHKVGLIIGKGGETIKHLQVNFELSRMQSTSGTVGARIRNVKIPNILKFCFPMVLKQDGPHFVNHWENRTYPL